MILERRSSLFSALDQSVDVVSCLEEQLHSSRECRIVSSGSSQVLFLNLPSLLEVDVKTPALRLEDVECRAHTVQIP